MTVAIKKHKNNKTREIGSTDQFVLMLHSEYEAKIHIILMAIYIIHFYIDQKRLLHMNAVTLKSRRFKYSRWFQ